MTIVLVIGVAALAWAVFTFNRLICLRQLGDNAWEIGRASCRERVFGYV